MQNALFSARDLHFSYSGVPVLAGVDLDIGQGEFVALVGPNGSGKSTLVKLILGLLQARSGSVETAKDCKIGYVPQRHFDQSPMPTTVEEVVASGVVDNTNWWRLRPSKYRQTVSDCLLSVGLADRASSLMTSLSGGQRQRVLIAKALAAKPSVLVLDEPVAGVDAASQRQFRSTLHDLTKQNTAVLLVSHELAAVADVLDRVVVLRRGRIEFDGSPGGLAAKGVNLGIHATDLPVWLEDS